MAGDSSVLTLSAALRAPESASAALTVYAAAGAIVRTARVQLAVSAAVVSVLLAPASVTVSAGRSATVAVQTSLQSGVTGPVELSATGAPAVVTISFEPSVVTAGSSSVQTIVAAQDAAATATSCTLHARFGSNARELPLPLTVLSAPTVS